MASFGSHSVLKIVWDVYEISVRQGKITTVSADAIAVSCSSSCSFSEGAAKAVAHAAGAGFKCSLHDIKQQTGFIRLNNGEAVVFSAGRLNAKYIIGVCSPKYAFLDDAYRNAFKAADEQHCTSLCLCAFGTGLLHIAPAYSASIAISVIDDLIKSSQLKYLKVIGFVDASYEVVNAFVAEFKRKALVNPNACATIDDRPVIGFVDASYEVVNAFVAEFKRKALVNPNACVTIDDRPVEQSEEDENRAEISDKAYIAIDPFVDIVSFPAVHGSADGSCTMSNINEGDVCVICLDSFNECTQNAAVKLNKCNHIFHKTCLERAFNELQAQCPSCKMWYGAPRGNQPSNALMYVTKRHGRIPGYDDANGHFEIVYKIPSGIQTREHPHPGRPYHGTLRFAYLPNNREGRKVLEMFRIAFRSRLMFTIGDSVTTGMKDVVVWNCIHNKTSIYGLEMFRIAFRSRLMFTIGDSVTTGMKDVVVWNCIHNKTSIYGGPQNFGYPDETYLDRVKDELAAVGVTEELLERFGKS
uniref:E3 ubiquitin-protein ligase n=1 Tax=Ascaris lumbricoides TaxID=6252 RepID=A0A0M3HXI2_ASCLU